MNDDWNEKAVKQLAKEIWWLRSPLRRKSENFEGTAQDFDIKFDSPEPEFVKSFEQEMDAILDIWNAKLVGKNEHGNVTLSLEFRDEEPIRDKYPIESPCELEGADFEIRIYSLHGKQRRGIKLDYAKDYLKEFGGIHVYDAGFHLPYYGNPENDWLRVEFDHSHRLSTSQLLPQRLQVEEGMNFLPTLSRVLGFVNVDTSQEKVLKIAITRDRFQESTAFSNLKRLVRYAMDFYAVHEAVRARPRLLASEDVEPLKFRNLEEVLDRHKDELSSETYEKLRTDMQVAAKEIESEAELTAERVSIFGPLATAGMTSLAYQHELKQQFAKFADIITQIDTLRNQVKDEKAENSLGQIKADLLTWIKKAERTNALFAYYDDAENMQTRARFHAKQVIDEIWRQVEFLARGVEIGTNRLEGNILLPRASLLEWSSIFQNVFLNAFNAMVESSRKMLDVSSRRKGRDWELLVQDTGVGVDLKDAETLFEPFVRKTRISPERRAMGYGGTGLGLTIVRLIAQNIGAIVSFVEPEDSFRTAFSLRWSEKE